MAPQHASPATRKPPGSDLDIPDDLAKLAKKARTRAAPSREDDVPDERGPQPLGMDFNRSATAAWDHHRDGRKCNFCQAGDDSEDPVFPGYILWWYPPKGGKSQGLVCWYCGRAWFVRYRVRQETNSLSKLLVEVGRDDELLKEFRSTRDFIVGKAKETGSKDFVVRPQEMATKVYTIKQTVNSIDDEAEWMPLPYYTKDYEGGRGDPRTNGRGDVLETIDGVLGVRLKASPIKKIRRSRQGIVQQVQRQDDGGSSSGYSQEIASQLARQFDLGFAVLGQPSSSSSSSSASGGQLASAALPAQPQQAAPPSSASASSSAAVIAPAASEHPLGFGAVKVEPFEVKPPQAAPPSGAGGAGAGTPKDKAQAKGKAGRKKRNLCQDAARAMQEFSMATPITPSYFGIGSKAMQGWLKRLVEDFTQRVGAIEEEEDYNGNSCLISSRLPSEPEKEAFQHDYT